MQIELWPLDRIKPYDKNPRLNDDAVDAVARSIQEFGFRQPIVVDEAGVVIIGHTRLKAAKQLGLTEVPVHVARGLSPEKVKALRIADNQTASLAEWNLDLLPIELAELQGMDFDLGLLGFDQDELARLLDAWFGNLARVLLPGRGFYIWGGYANCANYPPFLKKHGLYFSQAVIWDKQHPVLTRKDFMGNHEWCFYGWREGAAHQFFGPNNATDVWSVKKVNPQSMVHLTEKPVELAVRAMQYSSRAGENVLDPFGGSGSTLIAAEQTGRKAFLMELDPLYCDVICERWCKFTGQEAVCVDSQGTQTTRSERVARAQEPAT